MRVATNGDAPTQAAQAPVSWSTGTGDAANGQQQYGHFSQTGFGGLGHALTADLVPGSVPAGPVGNRAVGAIGSTGTGTGVGGNAGGNVGGGGGGGSFQSRTTSTTLSQITQAGP